MGKSHDHLIPYGDGLAINWLNYRFLWYDGYGLFGTYNVEALLNQGVQVHPYLVEMLEWPLPVRLASGFDPSLLTIALMPPYEMKHTQARVWNFTMYEGTGLDQRWMNGIRDYAERVIVPHEWFKDVLLDHHVKVPIHIIPGGTCPRRYPVTGTSPYQRTGVYTFLALGDRGGRKGHDMVMRAFFRAFENVNDVRLIIKFRSTARLRYSASMSDKRLSFWYEDVLDMNDVYAQADCYAFPSAGEGWGMPPREFAMTGKPTICTNWSGLTDGIDQWAYPIGYTMEPANLRTKCGEWALPSEDELVDRMRWCYDHPDDARQFGLSAAQWLRENQTWDHAAQKLVNLIREYA